MKLTSQNIILIGGVFSFNGHAIANNALKPTENCKRYIIRDSYNGKLKEIQNGVFYNKESKLVYFNENALKDYSHNEKAKIDLSNFDSICTLLDFDSASRMAFNESGDLPGKD